MGRPLPAPGEPLFTQDDTAAAIALAEEERDTCSSCGMPKAWCRDRANEHAFDVREDRCFATYRVALRREKNEKEGMHPASRQSVQLSPRFRTGHEPAIDAGLDFD